MSGLSPPPRPWQGKMLSPFEHNPAYTPLGSMIVRLTSQQRVENIFYKFSSLVRFTVFNVTPPLSQERVDISGFYCKTNTSQFHNAQFSDIQKQFVNSEHKVNHENKLKVIQSFSKELPTKDETAKTT